MSLQHSCSEISCSIFPHSREWVRARTRGFCPVLMPSAHREIYCSWFWWYPGPRLGNSPQSSSLLYSHSYMLPFSLQEDFKGQRHLVKFLPNIPLGSKAHYIKMTLVPSWRSQISNRKHESKEYIHWKTNSMLSRRRKRMCGSRDTFCIYSAASSVSTESCVLIWVAFLTLKNCER